MYLTAQMHYNENLPRKNPNENCVQIKSPRRQHILVEIRGTLIKQKQKQKTPKTYIFQHKYKPRPFTQKILDNIGSQ